MLKKNYHIAVPTAFQDDGIAGNIAPIKIQSWLENLLSGNTIQQEELDIITATLNAIYNGSPIVNVKWELGQLRNMQKTSRK
ncbi:hypothetical protein CHH91_11830 [Virgibacillus sp. 7505]|uniref:hypothetical protein n=1 Tax=Virgibacillus sp. 7505 TaxID=2022548 RepID=UPI000BA51B1B|nr:hypothetical protein [Virgibacillus sp. 7505]PAE15880.1 hypothetical protein CHH91_11830 [Virgibacillus sp. 7505]